MRTISIGRDHSCDIIIDDPRISRIHAHIIQNGAEFTYRDLSTNGSIINGLNIRNSDIIIQYGTSVLLASVIALPWDKVKNLLPTETVYSLSTSTIHQGYGFRGNTDSVIGMNLNQNYKPTNLPDKLRGWNWGAFFFGWLWAVFNGIYWPVFVIFFPPAFIVVNIVLGVNGSEWSWKNRNWRDISHFVETQRLWAIWGTVLFITGLVLFVLAIAVLISLN